MIATVSRLNKGHASYYGGGSNVLEEPDHEHVRPMARFEGEAAKKLGVGGQKIEENDPRLHNMFEGKSPDGNTQLRRLYDRERRDHRDGQKKTLHARPFFDVTLNAPKDISILYATGSTEDRAKILAAHQKATDSAMGYLSERAETRIDSIGKVTEPVKPVFAVIDHDTNRSNEPHLHSHVLLFNGGERKDGKWTALSAQPLFYEHHKIGAAYGERLEHEFGKAYENKTQRVELRKGHSFKVEGISDEARRGFSQRSEKIKDAREQLEARGIKSNPKVVQLAVLDTRELKDAERDKEATKLEWKQKAKKLKIDARKILRAKAEQKEHEQEKTQTKNQTTSEIADKDKKLKASIKKALPGTYKECQQRKLQLKQEQQASRGAAPAQPQRSPERIQSAGKTWVRVSDLTKKQPAVASGHTRQATAGKPQHKLPQPQARELSAEQVRYAEATATLNGQGIARTGQTVQSGQQVKTVARDRRLMKDTLIQVKRYVRKPKTPTTPVTPTAKGKEVQQQPVSRELGQMTAEDRSKFAKRDRRPIATPTGRKKVSSNYARLTERYIPATMPPSRSLRSPKKRTLKERAVDSLDRTRAGVKVLPRMIAKRPTQQQPPSTAKKVVRKVRSTRAKAIGMQRLATTQDSFRAVDTNKKSVAASPAKFIPDVGKYRGDVVAEKAHQDFVKGKRPLTAPTTPTVGERVVRTVPGGAKAADAALRAKYGKMQVKYVQTSQTPIPEEKKIRTVKLPNSSVARQMTQQQAHEHGAFRSR